MRDFQVARYIKKWLALILIFFVLMTFVFYSLFTSMQTYTASAVIRYSNKGASDGLTPSGEEIDIKEIYSSSVMTRVIQNLNLDINEYSIDKLSSSIEVSPVEKVESEAIKSALNEKGEEYKEKPTDYVVRFTAGSEASNEFARSVLNEVLDVYFSDYSERYVNVAAINNRTDEVLQGNYDYIEIMENLRESIDDTLTTLGIRDQSAPYFRSVSTGYSFGDLINEFGFLKDVEISKAFSDILKNQISKDKEVLLDKYQNRIVNYNLDIESEGKSVTAMLNIIDAYVQKMRDSGNTGITYDYILPDVYDNTRTDPLTGIRETSDKTVEYDKLLQSWIERKENEQFAIVDVAYCTYIIEELTAEKDISPEYRAQMEQDIQGLITSISAQMNNLYDVIEQTNEEYNAYIGALNISVLSSAAAYEKINVKLYTFIVSIFFLVLGCCGAILLGRLGDIVEYMFYIDRKLGCSNRLACDRYIDTHSNEVLSDHFGCISLRIKNQREMNEKYGRNASDSAAKQLKTILESLLSGVGRENFIGYNGGGHFIAFSEQISTREIDDLQNRIRILLLQDSVLNEMDINYFIGALVTKRAGIHSIRTLLTKTIESSVDFPPKTEDKVHNQAEYEPEDTEYKPAYEPQTEQEYEPEYEEYKPKYKPEHEQDLGREHIDP